MLEYSAAMSMHILWLSIGAPQVTWREHQNDQNGQCIDERSNEFPDDGERDRQLGKTCRGALRLRCTIVWYWVKVGQIWPTYCSHGSQWDSWRIAPLGLFVRSALALLDQFVIRFILLLISFVVRSARCTPYRPFASIVFIILPLMSTASFH